MEIPGIFLTPVFTWINNFFYILAGVGKVPVMSDDFFFLLLLFFVTDQTNNDRNCTLM